MQKSKRQLSTSSNESRKAAKEFKFQRKNSGYSSDYAQDISNHSFSRKQDIYHSLSLSKQLKTNSDVDSNESSVDFYQRFQGFLDLVRAIEKVRFEYMRELYNVEFEMFPTDEEVREIQELVMSSTQVNSRKLKKNWNDEERKVLVWIVGKYCAYKGVDFKNLNENDWQYIAGLMNRRDSFSCKQKWLSMLKMPLLQAPWSSKEDQTLNEIYVQFVQQKKSNKWSSISDELNRRMQQNIHRTGKQCRERWNNHLNPNLNREPWSDLEDLNLLQLVLRNGKKWALISKTLNIPRNENAVKNRFNCLMKKERTKDIEDIENSNELPDLSENFVFAEDLNPQDLKTINLAIQKVQWRLSQQRVSSDELLNKDEHKEELKSSHNENSIIIEEKNNNNNGLNLIQNKLQNLQLENKQQPSSKAEAQTQYTFQSDNISNVTQEELLSAQPCIVNLRKGVIYFLSHEQTQEFLNYHTSSQMILPNMQQEEQHEIPNPQHQSVDQLVYRTLNTIEELSNQGSMPSVGQFINCEMPDKYQLPGLDLYQSFGLISNEKIPSNGNIRYQYSSQNTSIQQPSLMFNPVTPNTLPNPNFPNFMNIFVNRGFPYYRNSFIQYPQMFPNRTDSILQQSNPPPIVRGSSTQASVPNQQPNKSFRIDSLAYLQDHL